MPLPPRGEPDGGTETMSADESPEDFAEYEIGRAREQEARS